MTGGAQHSAYVVELHVTGGAQHSACVVELHVAGGAWLPSQREGRG